MAAIMLTMWVSSLQFSEVSFPQKRGEVFDYTTNPNILHDFKDILLRHRFQVISFKSLRIVLVEIWIPPHKLPGVCRPREDEEDSGLMRIKHRVPFTVHYEVPPFFSKARISSKEPSFHDYPPPGCQKASPTLFNIVGF